MINYHLWVDKPVRMEITGKFIAPSQDWMHMNRILLDYELVVVTSGTLYISNGEMKFPISHGEYLLLPPLSPQFGYQSSDCSFYWLHFSTDHPVQATTDMTSTHSNSNNVGEIIIPQTGKLTSVEKLVVMMKQLQDCVRGYNEQTLNNYMTTTILCEIYNQVCSQQIEPSNRKQDQLYHDIVDYIRWRRSEPLRVSQIAEYFNYNEKYLSHLFRKKSGISLKQYMLGQTMELAKFLLTDTNQNINEISAQLGYKDSHNFMKSFKKIVGLTPTEFRNAYAQRLLFYE